MVYWFLVSYTTLTIGAAVDLWFCGLVVVAVYGISRDIQKRKAQKQTTGATPT
jgi:hypothetical protein